MEKTPIEGASRKLHLPGNPSKPELRKAAVRAVLDADCRSVERELHCGFHLISKKMSIKERNVRKIIAEIEAISWRLRECIRVRELAVAHRPGQMRRLRMLGEQKAWKREAVFDRIETVAKMHSVFDLTCWILFTRTCTIQGGLILPRNTRLK